MTKPVLIRRAQALRMLCARSIPAPAGETKQSFGIAQVVQAPRSSGSLRAALYRALIHHRRRLKPAVRVLSRWFDGALYSGRLGDKVLLFAYRNAKAHRRGLARAALAAFRLALVVAAQAHLAASQRASAINCARIMNLLFRSEVRSRRGLLAKWYFQILLLAAAHQRVAREMKQAEQVQDFTINLAAGTAHLYMLDQQKARHFLVRAAALAQDGSYQVRQRLGCSYLLSLEETSAAREFARAAEIFPPSIMAHHNNAARYDMSAYRPVAWELAEAGELAIYDNLIRLGEEFYLLGRFEDSMRAYQRAMRYQDRLGHGRSLPDALKTKIAQECSSFDPDRPVRLLGYEWVTQIGHMGFLDWHMRMVRLGMLPDANYVLLAPSSKVANAVMLDYLEKLYCVVRDPQLVDELFPYQRLFGDQFIAVRGEGELAEPWAHAAARAQRLWDEKGLPPQLLLTDNDREFGREVLHRLGLPPDAWYVGLHAREGGFHADGSGTTLAHRVAAIEDYIPAIQEIVKRGGWVIRLGDKSMKPLPGMPGLVDYPHTAEKSARMDIFLTATSRFVIGTTSGLTTSTQAFGTPMVLANCISNDCQFWTPQTDFILKLVVETRTGRFLSLAETYRQPLQSTLINATILAHFGFAVHNNSAEDIRAAVAYKLDCLDDSAQRPGEGDLLVKRFRETMRDNPYNFGSALPARSFLDAYPELLTTRG